MGNIFFDKISRLIWMQIKENEIVLENGKEMKHTLQYYQAYMYSVAWILANKPHDFLCIGLKISTSLPLPECFSHYTKVGFCSSYLQSPVDAM